jgi:hypothetical protein
MTLAARLPQGINLATPKILKQTAGDTWNGPGRCNDLQTTVGQPILT